MQLITGRQLRFVSPDGSAQRQFDEIELTREGPLLGQAAAILEGIDVAFDTDPSDPDNREDRHLGRLIVNLFAEVTGPRHITVRGDCVLRDWSGGDREFNGDDPFVATLSYSVLAD